MTKESAVSALRFCCLCLAALLGSAGSMAPAGETGAEVAPAVMTVPWGRDGFSPEVGCAWEVAAPGFADLRRNEFYLAPP
jgi:hypothetical protein